MEVLEDPDELLAIANYQTMLFGRDADFRRWREKATGTKVAIDPSMAPLRSKVDLSLAKVRLADLDFVGLTERFDESLLLLIDTICLLLDLDYQRANVTPASGRATKPTDRELDKIRSLNELDLELYDFAESLFSERFRRLRERAARALKLSFSETGTVENRSYVQKGLSAAP